SGATHNGVENKTDDENNTSSVRTVSGTVVHTPLIRANEQELEGHRAWLALLEKEAEGKVVWNEIEAESGS
ncbi:MAG: hypothetical protein WBM41_18745, partial [Arenicellales bacterium]